MAYSKPRHVSLLLFNPKSIEIQNMSMATGGIIKEDLIFGYFKVSCLFNFVVFALAMHAIYTLVGRLFFALVMDDSW